MANRKITDLTPQMQIKAIDFVRICKERGVVVCIYNTLRTLEEQAKLYRQGRTFFAISMKAQSLRKRGFGFLADILLSVGPQSGSVIVTSAAPGESFHNLAEAFDAVSLRDIDNDGDLDALWNSKEYEHEWSIMFDVAEEIGLTAGGRWKGFVDSPHFQFRSGTNPTKIYLPQKLKEIFILSNLLPKL